MLIKIENSTCIKCTKCVRICPSLVFLQKESEIVVHEQNLGGCISCGHCVAVCPTKSVLHSEFPDSKQHAIDYSMLPTPEQVLLLCKIRRSNRAFSKTPIDQRFLDLILEAAHRAPTASNLQQVEFTLVTSPEKLKLITDYTVGVFGSVVKKLENPLLKPILKRFMRGVYRYIPVFKRMEQELEKGNDMILRGATAVLLIHTPKGNRFGKADANLAYQNGSLMAESLGVSQFYTGLVCSAIEQDKQRSLAGQLGIQGKIHAGMGLGMPSFRMINYIDKKDIVVNKR